MSELLRQPAQLFDVGGKVAVVTGASGAFGALGAASPIGIGNITATNVTGGVGPSYAIDQGFLTWLNARLTTNMPNLILSVNSANNLDFTAAGIMLTKKLPAAAPTQTGGTHDHEPTDWR